MNNRTFKSLSSPLDEIQNFFSEKIDLFICAASYEERCLSIPTHIKAESVSRTVILKNKNVSGAGNENARRIENHFFGKANILEITKDIAIRTADQISKQIFDFKPDSASRVCVDTSCMTHETLLILFSLLEHIFPGDFEDIQYVYCPAKEYDPGTPDLQKWLSRGIKDVRSVLGYPGKLLPSRRNRLLVLVGFEVNRASSLINVYEPASLQLGYGTDGLNKDHHKINRQKFERLLGSYPRADQFEFSPADAYNVRDLILQDAESYSEFNLIVAPMNSKISTIGAALAVRERPEIQLCYAPATIYNFENYSVSDNRCISFRI
ncbi:hypothetical protein [Martelella limonii]|uniref:hypothetical protein n=1 Tax=Martelella limonii TaxID=1647649 RepID=UPI0015803247|nr:hypothetical protein [Martelella limonii]